MLVPVLATVTLLAVVAATAGALRSRSLASDPLGGGVGIATLSARWSQNVVVSILAVAALASVVAGVWMLRIRAQPGGQDDEEEVLARPPWWRRLLSTIVPIVLFALLVGAVARAQDHEDEPRRGQGGVQGVEADVPEAAPDVDWWFVGLTVALASIAAVVVARRWGPLPSPARAEVETADRESVLEAVDDSLDALLAEPDHRRAVVAAYARMEAWLARAGLGRAVWEAPAEYLARVLAEAGVRTGTAVTLTRLFERAKFSPHPVGPEMRQEAIDALVALRDELLVPDVGGPTADGAALGAPP